MAFQDVLVLATAQRNIDTVFALAAQLAGHERGHVVGLYVVEPLFGGGLPYTAGEAEIQTIEQQRTRLRQTALDEATKLETALRRAADGVGVAAEWRVGEGPVVETAIFHARHADITVIGQVDPEGPARAAPELVESVLMGSGRPVLVVPYAGRFNTIGRNVLLAWNATRESARAANDALPILKAAQLVTVMRVNPEGRGRNGAVRPTPGADIALHLARHGVKAEASFTVSTEVDVGNTILSRAADFGSDLIVMGGYGHSRMRELIVGGATRTILQHMTVPVLLSH
jgi:nucleotide-binding universal stress UspA family protein